MKGAMAMTHAKQVSNRRLSFASLNGVLAGCRLRFWLVMILFLFSSFTVRAQELAATLSGTVTDSSGAVLPNSTITITQNGVNGAARVVLSDGNGNYIATNLSAGTYEVKAVNTGFQTFVTRNVVLNVAEKHSLNIQMKTGSVSTTVTVEDNPVSVDTESSAQASTISGQQVRELELSSRNFEQLVTLQPGVVNAMTSDEASAGSTALAVNGARTTANNWTVDGADINDSGSNGTIINVPSVDAIQEFTLQRGTYDAGYGRSGGGQILVATKNGTSSFHGDAYEFVRNTVFDANTYINNLNGSPRSPNHHNVYGFTIGGPIYIPKVYNTNKNKTFFFWSEEWHKVSTPGNASMPAPSADELNGVVSGNFTNGPANCLSYDAATDTTTVSPTCYSQNSQVYLSNVFNGHSANTGGNYAFSYSQMQNLRNDIVRVDHYFNDKLRFYARGMNDDMPVNEPMGLWAGNNYPGLVNTAVNSPGKNVVGNLTWTISPKIVNEVEFVYSQGTYYSTINSGQFATSSTASGALTNNWAYPDPYGRVPAISFDGSTITGFSAGSAPWNERNLDRTYFDNLAITLGKHTLRTGFQFQQMLKTENATYGNPSFGFHSWGDFLLGNVESYTQASRDIIPDLHYINSEAYVQDDWKMNRRLTINLGVRWSGFPSPTDVKNTLNNFDPLLYSASSAPAIEPLSGRFVAGQMLNGNLLVPATYANGLIFPKGSACTQAQAIAPMVQCSPFGSYVNPNNYNNFGPRVGFAFNPDGRGTTSIRGGFGIFYDRLLNGIWEQNAFADPPLVQTTTINNTSFDQPSGANAISYGPNGLVATGTPTFKAPSYANYNLSLQHQVLTTTTFEIAYVGNVARHLLGEVDLNQPTLSQRAAAQNADVNAIRPYLGYAYLRTRAPIFTNNYNSLQVSLNHRSSRGLTLGVAYTWSKDLTTNSNDRDTSATYAYNLKLDYGPSSTNTPHIFEASYIYDLPWYKSQHGLAGHVLGGWEVSGITSAISGSSFSVTQATDPFACTTDSTSGLCAAGSPAGTGIHGLGIQQSINTHINPRADQVAAIQKTNTFKQWFSTSSFAHADGHFGTQGSNSLLGPGVQNWDLAAIKNIQLGEHLRFQFRGEFFNAFNHTNFWNVDYNLDDSSFGQITSTHVPRRIQLGGKLYF